MTTPAGRADADDDDLIQQWLDDLRDGTEPERIQARRGLAHVFERRAMYEEAADLLVSNVRAGACDADIFRWLARLYRAQGLEVLAMQAAAEAAKYLTPTTESIATTQPLAAPAPALALPPGACPTCGYVVSPHVRMTAFW
jgi:hypothetical protein